MKKKGGICEEKWRIMEDVSQKDELGITCKLFPYICEKGGEVVKL